MKNKLLAGCSLAVVIAMMMAAAPERSSSGAPGAHTGAPGEQTCAASGCHDDNSVNSGTASLSILIGDSISNYIPGKTYAVKIRIADAGVDRFGFQLLALNNATLKSAGAFHITDAGRTQLIQNTNVFTDRDYVTYTFNGTDAISGTAEWVVNWTAPVVAVGAVSFYAAGVSADDDMSDKGDHVYTSSKTLVANLKPEAK
jgi:hypothetical protein